MNFTTTRSLSRSSRITSWTAQIVAAAILGQTLFFKFAAAPESIALFEKLGAEPYGRIGLGIVELIAVILLLVPRTAVLGGVLTVGLMSGAVVSHLTVLGIDTNGDGGALFALAIVTLVSGLVVTGLRRAELPIVGRVLAPAAAAE